MDTSNPGICHFQIGDITVTALNDGAFEAQTAYLQGVPAPEIEDELRRTFRAVPPRITISAFMLTIAGQHILVDSGSGTAFGPDHGNLRKHLKTLGIAQTDIAKVLVTHAHIDHVSGLVDPAGAAYFPNAEIVMHEAEPAFWLNESLEAAAADKSGFVTARSALAPYANRLSTVKNNAEGAPGVSCVHLPGHTPGHSGWMITSGSDSLLIWGDVVHVPGIQFLRPEAGMGFDTDIEQGRKTRARILDQVATDRTRVAGMHLDFPCFGHVARGASGYAFVAEVWKPVA
jgi:glyoxylase-like metal-dependent hydrolase (beta-lactamase superfamily II)